MNRLRILAILACALATSAQAQIAFRAAESASAAAAGSGVITHVGAGGGDDRDNCGNITPSIPGGADGDLLIALVNARENNADVTMAGWNLLFFDQHNDGGGANDMRAYIFWRFATGGDPNTVSQSGGCSSIAARISRFRGVDPAQPFYNAPLPSANFDEQNSGDIDTGTEAAAGANDMLVVASFVADDRTVSAGGGWSQSFDQGFNVSRDAAIALHYRLGGPNSISNWDLSGGGNDRNTGVIFALRPAPVGALAISVPAGTTADDVMIASITVRPCSNTSGGACTVSVSAPAGWTTVRTVDQTTGAGTGGYGNRLIVYRRVATSAEPASYTWSFGGAPTHAGAAGAILSFIGVDTANPMVAEDGQATGSAFAHAAPGIDTGAVGHAMLVASHSANSAATWTPAAGMTERADVSSIGVPDDLGLSLLVSTEERVAAGPTGTRSATHSSPPAADTGATHLLALRPARPVLQWTMDQSSWNGTAGEVLDASGNGLHGTAMSGASTGTATPAIAGNPGSCQYGSFDGSNDFLEVGDDPRLDVTDELTVLVWIRPTAYGGELKTIASKDQNYEFHLNSAGRVNWWWGGGGAELTSAGTVPLNTWTHVAIVYSRSGGFQRIYLNGAQDPNTNNQTAQLVTNALPFQVGSDQGFAGRQFPGLIDEVVVYRSPLSAAAIQTVMNQTRPCVGSVDHFSISHAGSGVACADQTITITAHDSSHTAVDAGGLTLTLSTSNGRGTWTGIVAGGGVLTDNAPPGDGVATYTFASGSSQVALAFRYANLAAASETFGFNVVSGPLGEASGAANVADDPSLTLAQAGFQFLNVSAGTTTIPLQISGKPSDQGFGAATLRLRAIRTDDQTGACTGLFANQSRTVQLGAECNNPAACAARQVSINGTSIATSNDDGGSGAAGYSNVALSFNAASEADTVIAYPDAGNLSLHARYDLDPDLAGYEMLGGSNTFLVRPFGIAFRGADAATPIAHGTSAAAPVLAAAGDNFTMTLAAYQWGAGQDTSPLDGHPDANPTDVVDITGNGTTPNFAADVTVGIYANLPGVAAGAVRRGPTCAGAPTVTAAQWANGAATANDWCYTEAGNVGLFSFINYFGVLMVGASSYDGSTLNAGHVGRFRPKRFALDTSGGNAPTLANRAAAACAPASTFTYLGEGLRLTFRLLAQNAQGATTQNYTGAYARHDLTGGNPAAHFALGARSGAANLTARLTAAYQGAAAWSNGVFDATGANAILAIVGRAAPDSPDGPFAGVQFGIAPVDADGVAMDVLDLDADTNGANERRNLGVSTELRYGRLRLQNAVGSEKLALSVPLEVQSWNGAGFAANALDSCTTLPRSAFVLDGYTGSLDPAGGNCKTFVSQDPVAIAGGVGALSLAAPAFGASGSVRLTANLGTVAAGSFCDNATSGENAASAAARSYLLGRWHDAADTDGNPATAYDDNPAARAAFGLYGAQPGNFIYFRENF